MADEQHGIMIRSIDWREVFPFTHLFRAFRVAVHPSKLILALVALLAIYVGGNVLDKIWPSDYLVPWGGDEQLRVLPLEPPKSPDAKQGIFFTFFTYEVHCVDDVVRGFTGLGPVHRYGPGDAAYGFFVTGFQWLFTNHFLYALLFTVWFLIVWSVFGGAICRIAAVHVARDEKISVRQALRFSSGKILSFVFAPLIPLLILLLVAVIVAAGGWVLFHIPIVGPIVGGLAFVLPLLAGFVMALVLLGTVGGFNLMYPTIAVEGSDSFDAISRSFSYVFARPWRMAFYTIVAVIYGAITYVFVRFFIYVVLALTYTAVTWWFKSGSQPAIYFPKMWPPPHMDLLSYDIHYRDLKWSEDIAATGIAFWVYLLIGLLGAFAISFYFSANTIIYYLMRREVDATDLDDVYAEDADDDFGTAASESASVTATTGPATDPGPSAASSPATDAPPPSNP
jgi:hypothetical protein